MVNGKSGASVSGHAFVLVDQPYPWKMRSVFIWLLVSDACHRENEASLAVLPDLLLELDSMSEVWSFYFPWTLFQNTSHTRTALPPLKMK